MKNKLVLLLIILFITISNGKIILGVDLKYDFDFHDYINEYSDTYEYTSSTENRLQLTPRIGIMPSEFLEISPFILLGLNTIKRDEENYSYTVRSTSFDLGCGIGTFFHIIRGKFIHLSWGPQLQFQYELEPYGNLLPDYDKYVNIDITIGLPLNLDFQLNDMFAIRISSNVIDINYNKYLREFEGRTYTNNDFEIDLQSILSPALGFFFILK